MVGQRYANARRSGHSDDGYVRPDRYDEDVAVPDTSATTHRPRSLTSTVLVLAGIFLFVAPNSMFAVEAAAPWEIELVQWWGALLAALGWGWYTMLKRGLRDAVTRALTLVAPFSGLAGLVTDNRLFLIFGVSCALAGACRAGLIIGFDVHLAALQRVKS